MKPDVSQSCQTRFHARELTDSQRWPTAALRKRGELTMRTRGAEIDDGVEAPGELVEDANDTALTLDGELDLDRDTLSIEKDKTVRKMLTRVCTIPRENTLRHPHARRRTRLNMKTHIVDRTNV